MRGIRYYLVNDDHARFTLAKAVAQFLQENVEDRVFRSEERGDRENVVWPTIRD
jgi:hypothetical protein